MADADIGSIYPTKIPGYDANADIQAALRLYHYGSNTYLTSNIDEAQLVNPSIAYHLKTIQDSIDAINALGAGGTVSATEPTTVSEGYVWLDSSSTPGVSPVNPTAIYISGTPTSPTDGTLWVVKGSSPLLMKIYDSATSTWKTIGA
jgi:hypothetical protein